MKIFVCVKQVPDTRGKVSVKKDGTLDRSKMPTIINPDDMGAVETALRLKDSTGATVIAVTMGPAMAELMLHELYAMGVDRTVLVTARELVGSDTYGTSTVLAAVISSLGMCDDDIILCGRQAIDGDTAQVGPELAEKLGIAQVTYVADTLLDSGSLICRRLTENGYMTVKVSTPCLLSCVKEIGEPRYMSIRGVLDWDAARHMRTINYSELKTMPLFDGSVMGMSGSPTIVLTSFAMPKSAGGLTLEGTPEKMVSELFTLLEDQHVLD